MTERPTPPDRPRWGTGLTVVVFAVLAKGLAFIREPIIAAVFGASSSSDAYYVAIGLPFFLYNLLGLPFSLWVTARLAAHVVGDSSRGAASFYRQALWGACTTSVLVMIGLELLSGTMVHLYAPGLESARLTEATALSRIGALALPALVLQAVCGGRLFAWHRFSAVYAWLAVGSLVGLLGVVLLIPRYGAAGAVAAFVAAWWTAGLALLVLSLLGRADPPASGGVAWAEDLGSGVVYRAVAMQVFFQGSALLAYTFSSRLAPGEIAAVMFASKITMAIYETIILTVGILIFPRIARLVQQRDESGVGRAVIEALYRLLPLAVVAMVLVALSGTELVDLIYHRRAFKAHAAELVSRALLGYAPYVVGVALVEILHRAMVLRGRIAGYFIVFGVALVMNCVACLILVPRLGVMGVAFGSSIGVVTAGSGLWVYAQRRLRSIQTHALATLVARIAPAAAIAVAIVWPLRTWIGTPGSAVIEVWLLIGGAVLTGGLFFSLMHLFGHRWEWVFGTRDRRAPI